MTAFVITEKLNVNSAREGYEVEAARLTVAKIIATKRQVFVGTTLTIEDKQGNLLAVKKYGKWDGDGMNKIFEK